MANKWLLINPPTGKYIRDTRCQASVNDVFAIVERAPVDLAYIAGAISSNGGKCLIKDYPAEGKHLEDVSRDIKYFAANYVVINTTMFSYQDDLSICKICKKIAPNIVTIAKGAIFFYEPKNIMDQFPELDIAVARDEEKVFEELSAHPESLESINNITYRRGENIFTNLEYIHANLKLPTPMIDQINHKLYVRPDTNEMQATIVVGRGCSGKCIYCIAPLIGGNIVRYRTVSSILKEIELYYYKYGIVNFYFSADNFICNHKWVYDFCEAIIKLNFKISWLCTARADGITDEIMSIMKQSGCWGVSIGIESGSEEIQKLIKKNLTKKIVRDAISICKKYKIVTLLHFMMGFPWEKERNIRETINLAKKLKGNIIEFYIVTPFPGTELYQIVKKNSKLMLRESIFRVNQVKPTMNTYFLSSDEVVKFRKKAIRTIYFNPVFYFNQLKYIHSLVQLKYCTKFICRKITKIVFDRKGD